MRALPILLALAACGGHHGQVGGPPPPPAAAPGFPATRWVPGKPTYVLAARSVKDAQRALSDLADSFGMPFGHDSHDLGHVLEQLLAVDPLNPDALTAIGVDLAGGFALFSEAASPTFVVHLTSPEAMAAFFDRQRERGLTTQSVIVDGSEVFTASLGGAVKISWAVDKDWLWVHFTLPVDTAQAADWFTHSHHPQGAGWTADWTWASASGDALPSRSPGVVGFISVRDLVERFAPHAQDAMACMRLFQPVGRVGVAIEGDEHHAGSRISFDVGPAAQSIAAAILPPPPGWPALAAHAALAVQWNLDAAAIAKWLEPCAAVAELDLKKLDGYGVRTARAVLQTLDPDDKSGSGALALDLSSSKFFASQLDQIPHRSMLESSRTYGALKGHRVSIPFFLSFDYVLDDHLALLAIGDGVMDKLVMGAAPPPSPVLSVDVTPTALPEKTWEWMLRQAGAPGARTIADHLVRWKSAHIAVTAERDALVLEAVGNRR